MNMYTVILYLNDDDDREGNHLSVWHTNAENPSLALEEALADQAEASGGEVLDAVIIHGHHNDEMPYPIGSFHRNLNREG